MLVDGHGTTAARGPGAYLLRSLLQISEHLADFAAQLLVDVPLAPNRVVIGAQRVIRHLYETAFRHLAPLRFEQDAHMGRRAKRPCREYSEET